MNTSPKLSVHIGNVELDFVHLRLFAPGIWLLHIQTTNKIEPMLGDPLGIHFFEGYEDDHTRVMVEDERDFRIFGIEHGRHTTLAFILGKPLFPDDAMAGTAVIYSSLANDTKGRT